MKPVGVRAVFTDPIFLAGMVFCLSVVALIGWLFLRPDPSPQPPAAGPPSRLRCPACGEEVPYDPGLLGQPCQSCKDGQGYVVSVPSDGDASRVGRLVAFVVLASLFVEGAIYLAVRRYRHHSHSASREASRRLVWRCPFCGLKISYLTGQIGTGYRCSRCKTAFTLPGPDGSE
jgi:hypothetical protein